MARDPLEFDVEDASLFELGERNEFLKGQIGGLNKAARGRGGAPGQNVQDEQAREFSQKQIKVESEIFGRLSDIHESRSERAQALDEAFEAPIADSPDQWASDPSHFDYPGIDTPRR